MDGLITVTVRPLLATCLTNLHPIKRRYLVFRTNLDLTPVEEYGLHCTFLLFRKRFVPFDRDHRDIQRVDDEKIWQPVEN